MNESDLGKALLRGEDPLDIEALTIRVLRRDRRRMWFVGILCVVAWMLVVMLPWATILPMVAKVASQQAEINHHPPVNAADQQEQSIRLAIMVKQGTLATFIGSLASMFIAAICTVSLIVLSRRATLRQLNVRLAEISLQLKRLANDAK